MPKNASRKINKSVTFEPEVLKFLENKCRKQGVSVSSFVNDLVKRAVISEHEYYRQLASYHASEMFKFKCLADTAPDKPEKATLHEMAKIRDYAT